MKLKIILTVLFISLLQSCSTLRDSLLAGAGAGAAVGTGIGAGVQVPRKNQVKSMMLGAAIGSLIGTLVGYSKYKEKNSGALSPEVSANENDLINKTDDPSISKPIVRKVWVPAKIENDRYIGGHYEYLIERQSQWLSLDDEEKNNAKMD